MKTRKAICLLLCMGLISACSTIQGVEYDYNEEADFSRYKTYDWMPVPTKAKMDELVVERVKKAVTAELGARGLKKDSQNPDFLIAGHLGKEDKVEIEDWGYGYYGPRRVHRGSVRAGGGISTYHYEEGTLILDFVDAGSKKLVWRGSAKARVQNVDSPEKSEALIKEAVQKILQKYPPPSES